MKPKKKAVYRDKYFTHIEYEYRGHTYEVEYANGINICCTPAYIQHREAQADIDKAIESGNADKPLTKEYKYEGSAQEGFDFFWRMVNGD